MFYFNLINKNEIVHVYIINKEIFNYILLSYKY